jgi:O-antigen ligase
MGLDALLVRATFVIYFGCNFLLWWKANDTNGKAMITLHTKWIALFIAYYYLSVLWAFNKSDVFYYNNVLIQIFGASFCIINRVKKQEDIDRILRIIVLSLMYTLVLLIIKTPSSAWGTERVGEAIGMNSNGLGMRLAYGVIISLYLIRKRIIKSSFFYYLFCIVSFSSVALFTGSKKAVLILALGLMLHECFVSSRRLLFIKVLIIIVGLYGAYNLIMTNDMLYLILGRRIERFILTITGKQQIDGSTIIRNFFIQYAKKLFLENPILGCGANNFVSHMRHINYRLVAYSHNNYWELLSTLGAIGFCIYYSFFARLLKALVKLYRSGQKYRLSALMIVIIIIMLITDYANVSYMNDFNHIITAVAFCVWRINFNGSK